MLSGTATFLTIVDTLELESPGSFTGSLDAPNWTDLKKGRTSNAPPGAANPWRCPNRQVLHVKPSGETTCWRQARRVKLPQRHPPPANSLYESLSRIPPRRSIQEHLFLRLPALRPIRVSTILIPAR